MLKLKQQEKTASALDFIKQATHPEDVVAVHKSLSKKFDDAVREGNPDKIVRTANRLGLARKIVKKRGLEGLVKLRAN